LIVQQNKHTDSFVQLFEWARKELDMLEVKKREIISELARKLEAAGMQKNLIAVEVAKELEGYASVQYIRKCLGSEYKQASKVRQHQVCETSSANHNPTTASVVHDTQNDPNGSVETTTNASRLSKQQTNELEKRISTLENLLKPFSAHYDLDFEDGTSIPLTIEVEPQSKDVQVTLDKRRLAKNGR